MFSISLTGKVSGKSFNSLVEFSWVLWDSILHFLLAIEGADENEILGDANAGSS